MQVCCNFDVAWHNQHDLMSGQLLNPTRVFKIQWKHVNYISWWSLWISNTKQIFKKNLWHYVTDNWTHIFAVFDVAGQGLILDIVIWFMSPGRTYCLHSTESQRHDQFWDTHAKVHTAGVLWPVQAWWDVCKPWLLFPKHSTILRLDVWLWYVYSKQKQIGSSYPGWLTKLH